METVKVYVADNNNVLVTCPKCQNVRELDLLNKNVPYKVNAKCKCGGQFIIEFDKRTYYRKALGSTGVCFTTEDSDHKMIGILDISRSGLAFIKTKGKSFDVGDIVELEFTLDKITIRSTVTIVSVHDARIGAKFNQLDEHTKKVIGFFLMP